MARAATEVRDYSEGFIFFAPSGTSLPATLDAILALVDTPGAWTEVGYISEDGLEAAPARDKDEIKAWANRAVVRTVQTGFGFTFKFAMLQTNADTVELWQGDPDVVSATLPDHYAWVILAKDDTDHAIGYTVADGQPWEPEPLSLGGGTGLQWGVTVTTYPDANGNNANGPYIDDDLS